MQAEKEEQLFKKRMLELSKNAYHRGITKYTDFLNLSEISIFHSMEKEFYPAGTMLYGGYDGAERRMASFFDEDTVPAKEDFPVTCLKISPVNERFSEELKHPDYLGSILGLGIDRAKTGDILIHGKEAYCFCDSAIAPFIIESLTKIRHTNVRCSVAEADCEKTQPEFKEIVQSVSSYRLDVMASAAFHLSRTTISELIKGEKVYVNARLITSQSQNLCEGDIISVRGYGKFQFKETSHRTKKGRYAVTLLRYT